MRIKNFALGLLLLSALGVSACGSVPAAMTEPAAPATAAMAKKSDATMMADNSSDATMAEHTTGDNTTMADQGNEAMMTDNASDPMMAGHTTDNEAMMTDKSDEAMMADNASDSSMAGHATDNEAMMTDKSNEAMMADDTSDSAMAGKAASDDTMMSDKSDEAMMADQQTGSETMTQEVPAWFNADLTNVNTSQTFKITDFKGKVVLVETMAVWCPTCLRQQNNVQALHEALGQRDDFVSVALDIDPNEEADYLQQHAAKHGFDWIYAVTGPEVAREIGQLYGPQFLNPPSAPMFIIDRHGTVHPLPFGVKDAQTLQDALEPFLNET